jgi:hypothetical protein
MKQPGHSTVVLMKKTTRKFNQEDLTNIAKSDIVLLKIL